MSRSIAVTKGSKRDSFNRQDFTIRIVFFSFGSSKEEQSEVRTTSFVLCSARLYRSSSGAKAADAASSKGLQSVKVSGKLLRRV